MLHEEITSISSSLAVLLGRVDPESADFIRICRRNLDSAADTARELEQHFILPASPAQQLEVAHGKD